MPLRSSYLLLFRLLLCSFALRPATQRVLSDACDSRGRLPGQLRNQLLHIGSLGVNVSLRRSVRAARTVAELRRGIQLLLPLLLDGGELRPKEFANSIRVATEQRNYRNRNLG